MDRTKIGLAIIDKASLEDGILTIIHYHPMQKDPTPEDAKELMDKMLADKDFAQIIKETEASPICIPVTGVINDMFDEMTALAQTVINAQQPLKTAKKKNSIIITPDEINKEMDGIPPGAEAIMRSIGAVL